MGSSHAARLWHLPHPGQSSPIHASVPTRGRPSFKSKLLPRPKLRMSGTWRPTGRGSFQAAAWLLLILSFRQTRAVKPGSRLGSPGAARKERGSTQAHRDGVGAAPAPATGASRPRPAAQHCTGRRKALLAPLRPWERPSLGPVLPRPTAQS